MPPTTYENDNINSCRCLFARLARLSCLSRLSRFSCLFSINFISLSRLFHLVIPDKPDELDKPNKPNLLNRLNRPNRLFFFELNKKEDNVSDIAGRSLIVDPVFSRLGNFVVYGRGSFPAVSHSQNNCGVSSDGISTGINTFEICLKIFICLNQTPLIYFQIGGMFKK